jgi:hypothetical protein
MKQTERPSSAQPARPTQTNRTGTPLFFFLFFPAYHLPVDPMGQNHLLPRSRPGHDPLPDATISFSPSPSRDRNRFHIEAPILPTASCPVPPLSLHANRNRAREIYHRSPWSPPAKPVGIISVEGPRFISRPPTLSLSLALILRPPSRFFGCNL